MLRLYCELLATQSRYVAPAGTDRPYPAALPDTASAQHLWTRRKGRCTIPDYVGHSFIGLRFGLCTRLTQSETHPDQINRPNPSSSPVLKTAARHVILVRPTIALKYPGY